MPDKEILTLGPGKDIHEDPQYPQIADAKNSPTSIQVYTPPPLPVVKLDFDEIKDYIAPQNATDGEVKAFILVAEHCGLDPFKRQIYLVKPGGKATYITGYQVYIERAEYSGLLQDWHVEVDDYENPTIATGYIKRRDREKPFTWFTLRREVAFAPKSGGATFERPSHKNQPAFQLMKCWIGQAFRLVFPLQCGGIPYIPEELPATDTITSEQMESTPNSQLDQTHRPEDAEPTVPAAHADEMSADPPPFNFEYWKRRYFATFSVDTNTGEVRYPLVMAFFKNEEARRHKWQNTINPGKPSVNDWTDETFFHRAIKNIPILEQNLSEGTYDTSQPSDQPPDQESPHEQSPPPDNKDLNAIVEVISQLDARGIPDLDLRFYLSCRYLAPTIEPSEDLRTLLARATGSPAIFKNLHDTVKANAEWAEWVGGKPAVLMMITALHGVMTDAKDPETSIKIIQGFLERMGLVHHKGVYRLYEIKPSPDFETWPTQLTAACAHAGVDWNPDKSTRKDDEESQPLSEDTPGPDVTNDDIPF